VLSNGVRIPLGEVIDYPVAEEDKDFYCRLQHNEFVLTVMIILNPSVSDAGFILFMSRYIVYDAEQVQMRYLIQVTR